VEVVGAEEVEVNPFDPLRFSFSVSGERERMAYVTGKEIREMAERLGLLCDDAQITFAKKVMNAYIGRERH